MCITIIFAGMHMKMKYNPKFEAFLGNLKKNGGDAKTIDAALKGYKVCCEAVIARDCPVCKGEGYVDYSTLTGENRDLIRRVPDPIRKYAMRAEKGPCPASVDFDEYSGIPGTCDAGREITRLSKADQRALYGDVEANVFGENEEVNENELDFSEDRYGRMFDRDDI